MPRHVCIHGHFYQPERENPWLEAIERQDSAYPYHDWNARITAECYAPNARSRILDDAGRIVRIVNNYARISFDVGPTLLAWLETEAPDTYGAILRADAASQERFGGHGSAMAQVYNHMILPLADARDRRTQVVWGLRDFEHRFGRAPEGMWLPETAVDLASLEELAAAGVRFTVLAPHQAARVRPLSAGRSGGSAEVRSPGSADVRGPGSTDVPGGSADARGGGSAEVRRPGSTDVRGGGWTDVRGGRVDPTRAYVQRLRSGREIALFFYDGPVSRAVAFEGLLSDGTRFAERLAGLVRDGREGPRLAHIATDGESYGHHHRHGEMALSFALARLEEREDVHLTNYAEYLALHPPRHEVQILEGTSWSCAHGVERWRADCGCSTGGARGWSQAWRAPLREALDALRDRLRPLYEGRASALLRDPWRARDAYIDVLLDRSPSGLDRFFGAHASRRLDEAERVEALELLEMQRQAMLMYTSCGWFFSDLAGIETVQVLEYAGRAIHLAEKHFDDTLEATLLEPLSRARSNVAEEDGRVIYRRRVRPKRVELQDVCAHHALASLLDPAPERARVYCYAVTAEETRRAETDGRRLLAGVARVASEVTGASAHFEFAALHAGGHHLHAGVRPFTDEAAFRRTATELEEGLRAGPPGGSGAGEDLAAALLEAPFGGQTYSLRSIFRDAQQRVLAQLLEETLEDVADAYRALHRRHAPLMRFVAELGARQPRPLRMAGEFVLEETLRELLLRRDPPALERIAEAFTEARVEGLEPDGADLALGMAELVAALGREAAEAPTEPERLDRFLQAVELAEAAPFEVELWEAQNVFWSMLESEAPPLARRGEAGDPQARRALERIRALGGALGVAVPA